MYLFDLYLNLLTYLHKICLLILLIITIVFIVTIVITGSNITISIITIITFGVDCN